jgi:hypothetical protein
MPALLARTSRAAANVAAVARRPARWRGAVNSTSAPCSETTSGASMRARRTASAAGTGVVGVDEVERERPGQPPQRTASVGAAHAPQDQ